jgi:glutathione S-transferase
MHAHAVVHERAAIFIYLCDAFPAAGLAPSVGDPRRGAYLSWLVYNDAVLDPVIAAKFGGWSYDKRGVSFGSFDDMVANLNRALEQAPYLAGETFTAADLLLCGGLNFAVNFAKAVPATAAIKGFLERCLSRPAFARTVARDRAPAAGAST